jgi:cytochrome c biogenesis protein CcmG/thiol:disulfide interchange protein DsbE
MRRLLFLAPMALFGLVLLAFVIGLQRDPSKLPSVLIGRPLPAFALPAVRPGDVAGLASTDFQGQPAMLNVFASWCVACRLEHPVLLQLKDQGVPIHGLDWKDEARLGAQYLADNGDPYRKAGNDQSGRAGIDLGVTGVPETFVVDRRGRVRYKQVGAITPEIWSNTLQPLMLKLRSEP